MRWYPALVLFCAYILAAGAIRFFTQHLDKKDHFLGHWGKPIQIECVHTVKIKDNE